jgi:hypothetical protein
VSNGTIVLYGQLSDNRRILHGNGKESGKDPFYGGSFVMKLFESFGSVVDLFADARGQTNRNVASFLGEEFGMSGGADKISLPLLAEMNGTAVLEVSDSRPGMGSFTFPVHREICLAVDVLSFKGIRRRCGLASGVTRDDSSSFEVLNDETEDVFRVVGGVSPHDFDDEREGFFCVSEHGDGLGDFTHIGRMSDFPNRDFLWGVSHNVVSIAPEVANFFFEGLREMDLDSQPRIGISLWDSGFIETVGDGGFEIILPDVCQDGTRIHDQVFSSNHLFQQQGLNELDADVLEEVVWGIPKELRKTFDGGRSLIEVESEGLVDGRVVMEFEGQIGEGVNSS